MPHQILLEAKRENHQKNEGDVCCKPIIRGRNKLVKPVRPVRPRFSRGNRIRSTKKPLIHSLKLEKKVVPNLMLLSFTKSLLGWIR